MADFAAAPREAVAWIQERVKPAPPLDRQRVRTLIKELDDGQFKVRQSAAAGLLLMGESLLPVLDEALAADQPPESRRRLEDLRAKLTGFTLRGERLRVVRAVELLERIEALEARSWQPGK